MKNFVFFSYKWNLLNVFELKFWHEKLSSFDENVFGASYRLLLRLKNFFIFLGFMSHVLDQFEKKKLKIWKKIPKMFNFWNFICGSAAVILAENSIKNILLPKIIAKTILSKIRPLHHQKLQKVDPPPPEMVIFFFWGGVALYMWLIPIMF